MIAGQLAHAVHGLLANFTGISSEREDEIKQQGLKAIRAEFHNPEGSAEGRLGVSGSTTRKQEAAKHLAIVLYILDEATTELKEISNDRQEHHIVHDEGGHKGSCRWLISSSTQTRLQQSSNTPTSPPSGSTYHKYSAGSTGLCETRNSCTPSPPRHSPSASG
jgi:hypothetical protein